MDKQTIVKLMQLEEVTGIKLLEDDFSRGPRFVPGAAEKTFSNVLVGREMLGTTLEKLSGIAGLSVPSMIMDEKIGIIFPQGEIAAALVNITDKMADFLLLKNELLGKDERVEGETLVDIMRRKMMERTAHDMSKVVHDYGVVKLSPSNKVQSANAPRDTEYAIVLTESNIVDMGEFLSPEVHHSLVMAFNQRVDQYRNFRENTVEADPAE